MSEGLKTGIFAGIAVVAFGLAVWSRPAAISTESDLEKEIVGNAVFANFDDPDKGSVFQIVKYDEDLAQLERFEVARDKSTNLWRLPSFDDYPADAAEQVRDATTPLIGMRVLDIQSFDRGDHALYGVVNPDDEDLTVSESGVGMLVRVKDDKDQILASLIIGKEVEQAQGQRYVRVPTEDAVYVVELDTAPFTTDFTKWIKGELLGVRSFDINEIGLRDYAVLPTQRGLELRRNFDADLMYEASTSKWSLARMVSYEGGTAADVTLGPDEELQTQSLNDLRNAIQDLQIVDVRRKPTGLAADLKADKSLMENNESLQSLYKQGFFPQETPSGFEVFATGGETLVGTKDGVKYVLRFGESTAQLSGLKDEAAEGDDLGGLRRFLLVTAQLDESDFPPPELKPVPETVEEMLAAEREAGGETSAAVTETMPAGTDASDAVTNEAPADPAVAGDEPATSDAPPEPEPPTAEEPAAEEPTAEESANEEPTAEEPAADQPATDEPVADEPAPGATTVDVPTQEDPADDEESLNQCGPQEPEEPQEDEPATNEPATNERATNERATNEPAAGEAATPAQETSAKAPQQEPAGDTPQPPPAQESTTQESAEELQERLEFTRETITKENQRKIDERNEKIDLARKKVQELNARFADWYYVVSDSVYQKLTLSRDKLIKPKSADSAPAGLPPGPAGFPGGGLPPGFPNLQP